MSNIRRKAACWSSGSSDSDMLLRGPAGLSRALLVLRRNFRLCAQPILLREAILAAPFDPEFVGSGADRVLQVSGRVLGLGCRGADRLRLRLGGSYAGTGGGGHFGTPTPNSKDTPNGCSPPHGERPGRRRLAY